ncbi:MAG: diacylglycerol/lipid kinase family protein [Eubacteriales bacterium]
MKAAVPLVLPNVNERRHVHILNPTSGGNKYFDAACRAIEKQGGEKLVSESPGHIRELTADLFSRDPFAHAIIYGGDGSVFEAVNGIMDSGSASTASFSVIPVGSGNDFSSYANDSGDFQKSELTRIDLIKTKFGDDVFYFANMMNIGFDCSVVKETYTLKKKPFLHGSAAYIAGVLKVLAIKKTFDAKIRLTGCVSLDDGSALDDICEDKKLLLTACANSRFCGGGFNAASLASLTDGFMDVLVVNDVTRLKFLSLVGDYRTGEYITSTGEIKDKFRDVIRYIRCKKMEITGPEMICLDGEIYETDRENRITAEVCRDAVWFVAL